MVEKILVIGLGLMGGSLALGLKAKGEKERLVLGFDQNPQVVAQAVEMEAVDRGYTDLGEAVSAADIIFLALPHAQVLKLAPLLADILPPGALVTDMTSTKETIVDAIEAVLPLGRDFVGGHPMTGSEQQGLAAADINLFENAAYVLTPLSTTSPEAVSRVSDLVGELGAEVIIISPKKHDKIVAAISHLPHLIAGALVRTAATGEDKDLALSLAAGSFRDGTRVSISPPEMWRDICLENREALLSYLELFEKQLSDVKEAVRQGQKEKLESFFSTARDLRQKLPPRGKGFLTPLFDLVVLVEDTPGIIGEMASLLGQAGINIAEIEVLRVREAEEGSIRFAFKTVKERDSAQNLLKRGGIKAWKRG